MTTTKELPSSEQLETLAGACIAELEKKWDKRDGERAANLVKEYEDKFNAMKREFVAANPNFSLPGTERSGDPKKDFSLARASLAIATNDWRHAGLEREIFNQTSKTMSTGVDSAGGFLVPPQVIQSVIEPLTAEAVCFKLGVRNLTGLPYAPTSIPRQATDVTAQWLGENAASTLSQPRIEQINVRPRQLVARTEMTKMLLNAPGPAADQMVQRSMTRQFALAIDLATLLGTGASGQPTGIANQPGVGSSTLAGPTYNQLMDMVHTVRNANALRGKPGWALSPTKLNAIAQMADASNQPLQRRLVAEGIMDTLVGFPYAFTTQLPTTGLNAAIFGDWESAFVMQFGAVELLASNVSDTAMANNSVQIRMVMYADINFDQVRSFCVASA